MFTFLAAALLLAASALTAALIGQATLAATFATGSVTVAVEGVRRLLGGGAGPAVRGQRPHVAKQRLLTHSSGTTPEGRGDA